MSEYIAAICEDDKGRHWRLTGDRKKVLEADDQGKVIYVDNIGELVAELSRRNPAPEGCLNVAANDVLPDVPYSWRCSKDSAEVHEIPLLESCDSNQAYAIAEKLGSVWVNAAKMFGGPVHYNTLLSRRGFVIDDVAGGWAVLTYSMRKYNYRRRAVKYGVNGKLKAGSVPANAVYGLHAYMRAMALEWYAPLAKLYTPHYRNWYQGPGNRDSVYKALPDAYKLFKDLGLMSKLRKQKKYREFIKYSIQFIPGMKRKLATGKLNRLDTVDGLSTAVKVLTNAAHSLRLKVPTKIGRREYTLKV